MNQLIDPTLARNMAENTDLAAQQRKFDAMRRELNNGAPKDKKQKLREACEGFEAVFIQKMWEQMRATVPENGLTHSKDEKLWQGMYDQELSKKMAGAGGIGLADMMMTQLGKNLEDAGTKALNTSLRDRQSIPIAPAPLLLNAEVTPKAPVKTLTTGPTDMYSGAAQAVPEGSEASEPVAGAPAFSEFDKLVGDLHTEMQQPAVTVTRITTNSTSIGAFNSLKPVRSGRGQTNPRVVRQVAPHNEPQALTSGAQASALPQVAGMQPQAASGQSPQAASGQPPQAASRQSPQAVAGAYSRAAGVQAPITPGMQPQAVSGQSPQAAYRQSPQANFAMSPLADADALLRESVSIASTQSPAQAPVGVMPSPAGVIETAEAPLDPAQRDVSWKTQQSAITAPKADISPRMSPSAVSQKRTTTLAPTSRYHR